MRLIAINRVTALLFTTFKSRINTITMENYRSYVNCRENCLLHKPKHMWTRTHKHVYTHKHQLHQLTWSKSVTACSDIYVTARSSNCHSGRERHRYGTLYPTTTDPLDNLSAPVPGLRGCPPSLSSFPLCLYGIWLAVCILAERVWLWALTLVSWLY